MAKQNFRCAGCGTRVERGIFQFILSILKPKKSVFEMVKCLMGTFVCFMYFKFNNLKLYFIQSYEN